jgi:nucleotide-binding universal stress UspA family protein
MTRILIPFDGSPSSRRAVEHVIAASAPSADRQIVLLNVQDYDPSAAAFLSQDRHVEAQRAAAATVLDEAAEMLGRRGISCERDVRVGTIADAVIDAVKDDRIDQVVMGTRGLGSLAGAILGSVATAVVHKVAVPVTLVK